jgi:hypothetical protein
MDTRVSREFIVVAAIVVAASMSVRAQEQPSRPFIASHPVLSASLDRLHAGSAAWREAVDALSGTGRHVIVVTPEKVSGRAGADGSYEFDSDVLAGARPIADQQSRVDTVIVVVNLSELQRLSGLPMASVEFQNDVDRILSHEVFGHAVPFLLAGHLDGTCADPERGQNATDACAVKRENVIRRELKLGLRVDYGRKGLSLSRRYQQ